MASCLIIFALLTLCLKLAGAAITPFPDGGCGGTYEDDVEGTITSPGYPNENYPSEANCTYLVIAPPGSIVSYYSTFMDLEEPDEISETNCLYDYVTIYDGDDIISAYCGNQRIYLTTTKTGEFRVEFLSDFSGEFKGFSISWRVFNPKERKISPNCNFDDPLPLCNGWENMNEKYLWLFTRGMSPSPNTGPLYDHTTKSDDGRYAFIEATDAEPGTNATLTSPAILFTGTSNKRCLNFWYHMHGAGTGNLTVTLDQSSGETEIVQLVGEKGTEWLEMNQTFTLTGLFATVSFIAFPGENYMSDIAIDDIRVTVGSCPGDEHIDDEPMNDGGGSIAGPGRGFRINNIVPICLGDMINFNCAKVCYLTCEEYSLGSTNCSRTCTGQCACPQNSPIFKNGRCVDGSSCPTPKPVTADETTAVLTTTAPATTLSRDDFEKRKEIHEALANDFLAALLLYLKDTT